jgi:hypothetical protein
MAGAQSGRFYVLAEKDSSTSYYKVGTTKDLDATKSELQTSNPNMEYEVKVDLEVPDMDAAERSAHDAVRRQYPPDTKRGNGWYNIKINQEDFLTRIKFAVINKHIQKYPGVIQKSVED